MLKVVRDLLLEWLGMLGLCYFAPVDVDNERGREVNQGVLHGHCYLYLLGLLHLLLLRVTRGKFEIKFFCVASVI